MDRLEIEKRALKGRTFESEDGESQEGAAQIHGYHSFYIFSTYRQDTDEEDHQHHTGHHLPWMGRYRRSRGIGVLTLQVGQKDHTNTPKLKGEMPQMLKSKQKARRIRKRRCAKKPPHSKSEGKAQRIPKRSGHKCLRRSSRKDRPNEYQKAPGTNATKGQVEPAGSLFPCHQCYSNDNKRDSQYFPESEEGMEEEEGKDDGR